MIQLHSSLCVVFMDSAYTGKRPHPASQIASVSLYPRNLLACQITLVARDLKSSFKIDFTDYYLYTLWIDKIYCFIASWKSDANFINKFK